jgi:hypothetical protein
MQATKRRVNSGSGSDALRADLLTSLPDNIAQLLPYAYFIPRRLHPSRADRLDRAHQRHKSASGNAKADPETTAASGTDACAEGAGQWPAAYGAGQTRKATGCRVTP